MTDQSLILRFSSALLAALYDELRQDLEDEADEDARTLISETMTRIFCELTSRNLGASNSVREPDAHVVMLLDGQDLVDFIETIVLNASRRDIQTLRIEQRQSGFAYKFNNYTWSPTIGRHEVTYPAPS